MKFLYFFSFIISCAILSSCSSTKSSTSIATSSPSRYVQKNDGSIETNDPTISLADYLRRLPGVMVEGDGANARVRVRGLAHSFVGGSDPLFIVNGQQVGNNFSMIYSTLNPVDIKSVRVLKEPADTSFYGSRAGNGVIVIHTRTGKK